MKLRSLTPRLPLARHRQAGLELDRSLARTAGKRQVADLGASIHDFCVELLQGRGQVGDATWARTVGRFGEPAVVDLVATCGYYGLLALVMNAARTRA